MKTKVIIIAIALFSASIGMSQNKADMKKYEALWAEIEQSRGLPRTLTDKIDAVYRMALKDENYEQALKALVWQLNNIALRKENDVAAPMLFDTLRYDVAHFPQPARSVACSMLAQMYQQYYEMNAWTINSRTNTAIEPDDVQTWDARRLTEEATHYYMASIRDEATLQATPTDDYKAALTPGYSSDFQPTLYDVLAMRAMNYLASSFNTASLPQQTFTIGDPQYFADVKTFTALDIQTPDTLSPLFLCLKIYQKLLAFHLSRGESDIKALIECDLNRMGFMRAKGVYEDCDAMYEAALRRMCDEYAAAPYSDKIRLTLAKYYCDKADAWRGQKNPADKDGYVKAFEIVSNLKSLTDNMSQTADRLKERILKKEMNIRFEDVQLPGKPFLAMLQFRNLSAVYQTVYQLTEKDVIDYMTNIYRTVDGKRYTEVEFVSKLKSKPELRRIDLPKQTDYQYYTTTVRCEGLSAGAYLILTSDEASPFKSDNYFAALVQASSLASGDMQQDEELKVLVTDRSAGAPVKDAQVSIFETTGKSKPAATNKDGLATFNLRTLQTKGYQLRYTISHGSDILYVDGMFNYYSNRQNSEQDRKEAIILTDRAIYRPGQTLFYKGILYLIHPDNSKDLVRQNVTVRLRDANNQIVRETAQTADDFCAVDGSFTLPQGLLNGVMYLEIEGFGTANFRVEEYKRPTFTVKFDTLRDNFTLNQDIKITGQASALAGYAIDGANVQYRVRRTVTYRFWDMLFAGRSIEREIASGAVTTDGKGAFTIDFKALADDVKDDGKIYNFIVTADVTDVNGETRTAQTSVMLSRKPLLIKSNIGARVLMDKKGDCTVETTNLNGAITPATLNVEITALQAPKQILRNSLFGEKIDFQSIPEDVFRRDFPCDAYGDEMYIANCKPLNKVAEYKLEITDTKVHPDLSALKTSGYYRMAFRGDNHKGTVVEDTVYFCLVSDKPEPIRTMNEWFTPVKTKGEVGEQAELRIAGGLPETFVYYELVHKAQIIESKWVKTGTTPVSLTFPVKEEYRGGFAVRLKMVQNNRYYSSNQTITVPYSNKSLDISLATFREQLLPGESETWTMRIAPKDNAAQIAATLYDASLDAFAPHSWPSFASIYNPSYQYFLQDWKDITVNRFATQRRSVYPRPVEPVQLTVTRADINWEGGEYLSAFRRTGGRGMLRTMAMSEASSSSLLYAADMALNEEVTVVGFGTQKKESMAGSTADGEYMIRGLPAGAASANTVFPPEINEEANAADLSAIATRTNFNETAFFYPRLVTDENGEVLIQFTIPEALTKWKLLSFAHTKDFKAGTYTNELLTQKQVAVSANAPRFFRENDVIEFAAKVNNLTESALAGEALLRLYDAVTMQDITEQLIAKADAVVAAFSVPEGGSAGLKWRLKIPEGVQAVTYKLTAQAGAHSDGEEKTVPVLTNRMLVTESMPFSIRAGQTKSLTFKRMTDHKSKTLRNHSLTLEFTSTPAWYAVQSLPYIMEYPYECAEQMFSRYYANALATSIVSRTPRLKQIFELWKTQDEGKALLSALEKNQELKQVMLEETPWVICAQNETENKRRLGLLLDLNRMSSELERTFNKLEKMQNSDGGFPWFDSSPSSRFITQHIVAGFGRLQRLAPDAVGKAQNIVAKALPYLDEQLSQDYSRLQSSGSDLKTQQISQIQLHCLYARSFNSYEDKSDAFNYYLEQTAKYWNKFALYEQGLAAIVLHRYGKKDEAQKILEILKESAMQSDEMGMYWKENVAGWFWYKAPIETQALLIEAFNEITGDAEAVNEMRIWLLRNKQTNDWKTTKATTDAIFALLYDASSAKEATPSLLDEAKLLQVEIGGKPLQEAAAEPLRAEAGTGYVKTAWQGAAVKPKMANLKVTNPNGKGIAWGALYWQYFEQLDKITAAQTGLQINKQLFLRALTPQGETLQPLNVLKPGDMVRVRMELRADRDYEYVHLKDMRASGLEPVSAISGYRSQDGLWYYQSVKDASHNFFITYLPKGVYVFEYDLRVQHAGTFSNGITTFQCMYAPEFAAHSEGGTVVVSDE